MRAALALLLLTACASPAGSGSATHEAPELEAVLPETVNGETLEPGSIVGHEYVERTAEVSGLDGAAFEGVVQDDGVELEQLRQASASPNGGLDVVRVVPWGDDAGPYSFELMIWIAGITPEEFFGDQNPLPEETIGGKLVGIGSPDLMVYESPNRRPYFYGTEGYQFVIITDDRAWAEDVLEQLP